MPISTHQFKQLNVAIVGGGLGGLSAAVALRRAGHLGKLHTHLSTGDTFAPNDVKITYFYATCRDQSPSTSVGRLMSRLERASVVLPMVRLRQWRFTWPD
jgi:salicylate hydroxylase